jgi:two-component sensor histidine kinase/PAS domain-containing protein
MVFFEDVVGRRTHRGRQSLLDQAYQDRRIVRQKDPIFRDDMPVREEAIPVVRNGRALAVITRHTNLAAMRTPSRLELTYQALADALARMIAAGEFPNASAPTGQRRGAPRVGDGVIRLDVNGIVSYASPNALSAIHRLGHVGDVIGELLAKVVADLLRDESPVDESLAVVVTGRAPWRTEVTSRGASVSMRAIPLTEGGQRIGALLLLRDVSELRRREQELLTKEATIREIHHRVKNNLQTVAALLRLQARRLPAGEPGRVALDEAVRRVGVIALVHETLSQGFDETVNFDEIAVRGLQAITEVAKVEHPITSTVNGSFGVLRAEDATAMAMVLSELVQNAVEHGLAETGGGSICVEADRVVGENGDDLLTVTITDDGMGLPEDFRPGGSGLGTQIVRSLVQDLRGRIVWEAASPRGTRVRFVARLRPLARES